MARREVGQSYTPSVEQDRNALETDWPVGAGGFESLHFRIGIREDSQLWAA